MVLAIILLVCCPNGATISEMGEVMRLEKGTEMTFDTVEDMTHTSTTITGECMWLSPDKYHEKIYGDSGTRLLDLFPEGMGLIGTQDFTRIFEIVAMDRQSFEEYVGELEG